MKRVLFNIIIFGIVSLLIDLSSETIKPILPAFLISLGASSFVIGLAGGFMEAVPNLLKVFSGYFSDKIQKYKPFIFLGYGISALFKFFLIFARSWQQAIIFIAIERCGKGIRDPPRDKMIAEYRERGYGFGIHRTFDTIGAIMGSILAFILIIIGISLRKIILIASAIAFFSLIPLLFVKEKRKKRINIKSNKVKINKKLKKFFVVASIFAISNFSYMFFILNAMKIMKNSLIVPILLYVLFNIFYASFSIPFGKLSDKIGRKKVLLIGYLIFSFICLLFAFFNSLFLSIIVFILYGISLASIDANQRAYVSDLAGKNKATALGIFYTLIGVLAIIANIIAGFLFEINSMFTFLYGFFVSIISFIIFLFIE